MWECEVFQDIEVGVIGNDIGGVGSKSTINEFVVIGVGSDGMEFEVRVYEFHVIALDNSPDYILGNGRRSLLSNYLLIFLRISLDTQSTKRSA